MSAAVEERVTLTWPPSREDWEALVRQVAELERAVTRSLRQEIADLSREDVHQAGKIAARERTLAELRGQR